MGSATLERAGLPRRTAEHRVRCLRHSQRAHGNPQTDGYLAGAGAGWGAFGTSPAGAARGALMRYSCGPFHKIAVPILLFAGGLPTALSAGASPVCPSGLNDTRSL